MKVNITSLRAHFHNKRARKISLIVLFMLPILIMLIYLGGVYSYKSLPQSSIYKIEYTLNKKNPERAYIYLRILKSTIDTDAFNQKEYLNFISLLTTHISKYPNDPHNTDYYAMTADSYLKLDAHSQAVYYYLKSISMPAALLTTSQYVILQKLSSYDTVAMRNIFYLNELRKNYSEKTDLLQTEYRLGSLYDIFADWDNAYTAYGRYLNIYFFGASSSLASESIKYAEDIFFRYHRSYLNTSQTFENAQDAKNALLQAFKSRQRRAIKTLKAPKFFTAQWNESPIDSNAQIPNFDIIQVLRDSHFNASPKLIPSAGDKVLWTTYGWLRVNTWNMVFREIHQPDTIALNGRWEWAGIYFGTGNNLYAPR